MSIINNLRNPNRHLWEVNFEPAFQNCGKPPPFFQFKIEFPKPLLLKFHTN